LTSPEPVPFSITLRRNAPRALALVMVSLVIILLCYHFGIEAMATSRQPLLPPLLSITVAGVLGLWLAYLFYTALFRGCLHRRPLAPPWRSWVTLGLALSPAGVGLAAAAVSLVPLAGVPFYTFSLLAVLVCGFQMARGKL